LGPGAGRERLPAAPGLLEQQHLDLEHDRAGRGHVSPLGLGPRREQRRRPGQPVRRLGLLQQHGLLVDVRALASRGLHLLVAISLSASWLSVTVPAAHALVAAGHTPSTLPGGRLEFGLSNLDATWMTASSVPWRYRFQYLAGGVNTSGNWLTWQDPAKP